MKFLDRILGHLLAGSALGDLPKPGTRAWLYRYSVWLRIYRLALKPDWRYWMRQITRESVSPADWKFIRLPSALFWLYPFVRPVGWLVRQWQK